MRFALVLALVGCSSPAEMDAAKIDVTKVFTAKLVNETYARWSLRNTDKPCPAKLDELILYLDNEGNDDPWGNVYVMTCDAKGLTIRSAGPDGKLETADDIVSPRPHEKH